MATVCLGEVSLQWGTEKGKWEAVKTNCLSFNNLEECWAWRRHSTGKGARGWQQEPHPHSSRWLARKLLSGRPSGCREQRASVPATVRGQATFVPTTLHSPLWMGPCCCQTGWSKSQTIKMTCLAAISLIKTDSFQR